MALAGVSIEFQARVLPEYLLLECTGTFTLNSVLALYRQAFDLAEANGRGAVLIDARNLTGREPTLAERYEGAVYVADVQSRQKPRIRLAVLGHEPLIHPERFGEIVATNRGALARVFTDETLALDWLLAPSKPA